jgi:transmembrane sensor
MKQYKDYEVEDFLADDDFVQWIRSGSPGNGLIWQELLAAYPEKKADLDEARTFILRIQADSSLSDAELTHEVNRILASTSPAIEVPVRRLNSRSGWWQAAAAVLLLVGIGWSIWQYWPATPSYAYERVVKSSDLPLTEVASAQGESRVVTLPDGSRITLTGQSKLSYVRDMDKRSVREVFLTGEAFFEVTKNPKRPFLVYADGLVTRVVGTSFTIRTGGKQVSVVVRTGRVAVYPMQETDQPVKLAEKLMLTPNQKATYRTEANELTRTITDQPLLVPTESDQEAVTFQFDNTPITDVFARLEKAYGLSIVYDKAVLKNCQLTVPMTDEPFFTKLDIICQTIGASYKVEGTQVVITGAGCD